MFFWLGFIAAAWVSGTLLERKEPSFIWSLFSLSWGLVCILLLGATWLAFFIGIQDAIYFGIVTILPGGILKLIAAASLSPIERIYACSHLFKETIMFKTFQSKNFAMQKQVAKK
jgi:biotin transporter BioY